MYQIIGQCPVIQDIKVNNLNNSHLRKIFSLLDCFTVEKPKIGVREASRLLDISSSTAGRLLAELRDEGVLTQDPENKSYELGGRVLKWATTYISVSDLRKKAQPYLKILQNETDETISLYTAELYDRVCLEIIESKQTVRIVEPIGTRIKIYAGSGGKAILAFRSDEEIKDVIEHAVTIDHNLNQQESEWLKQELDEIKKTGISISHGEWHFEASGIASPIFNSKGIPIGSISISGPTQRFRDPQKLKLYSEFLLKYTRKISYDLGLLESINFEQQDMDWFTKHALSESKFQSRGQEN